MSKFLIQSIFEEVFEGADAKAALKAAKKIGFISKPTLLVVQRINDNQDAIERISKILIVGLKEVIPQVVPHWDQVKWLRLLAEKMNKTHTLKQPSRLQKVWDEIQAMMEVKPFKFPCRTERAQKNEKLGRHSNSEMNTARRCLRNAFQDALEDVEGDLSFAAMYISDAADHLEIATRLNQGDVTGAANLADNLDTGSREEIKMSTWKFLYGTLYPGQY